MNLMYIYLFVIEKIISTPQTVILPILLFSTRTKIDGATIIPFMLAL